LITLLTVLICLFSQTQGSEKSSCEIDNLKLDQNSQPVRHFSFVYSFFIYKIAYLYKWLFGFFQGIYLPNIKSEQIFNIPLYFSVC